MLAIQSELVEYTFYKNAFRLNELILMYLLLFSILKSLHSLDTVDLVVVGWATMIFWSFVAIFVVC